jgi:hypothetical protein
MRRPPPLGDDHRPAPRRLSDESGSLANYAVVRGALAVPMMDAVARLATYEWQPDQVKELHLQMNQAMRNEWNFLRSLDAVPHQWNADFVAVV